MSNEAKMKAVMEDFQKKMIEFQERRIEVCYSSNSENVGGFTKCMTKSVEELEATDKQISMLMMFAQMKAERCVQSGKDAEFCTTGVTKLIEEKLGEIGRAFK